MFILDAIVGLVGGICKVFIKDVYPLIAKFYKLFEYISTYKLLDSVFLNRVWNNIYIFAAVIVLFAIAIKLISAMVNPDTLSDNKKGVKNYYFRSVVAVVLIFIIPILFDYSFELQQDLLSNNFLTSRIFGFKVKAGSDVGKILAWETFNSFCTPVDADELNEDLKNAYIMVQDDPNGWNIAYLINKMNDTDKPADQLTKNELQTSFRLYPILCFIAGAIIAYELLLLCMDTLFRSAKLAFLEMMVPIVLGAYVFNPDILKKWAKEFFSTYIALFLKVLALGFMILSLSQIKGIINQETSFKNDQLLAGLFQAILVIGLLQLVKKIPDLINSIFGTNIKNAGGIKGRLGEMAGIGGLAQKAWTTLGAKARNLAVAGTIGAAAAVPAGLGALVNAGYKKKFGKDIADTKLGRWTRGIGSGIASAANTGNVGKAFAAGKESYNKLSTDPLNRVRRTAQINKNLDKILTNSGNNSVINETNLDDKNRAASEISNMTARYGGSAVDKANRKYQNRVQAQNVAQSMAKNYNTVLEENEKAAQHWELAGRADLAKKIRDENEIFKSDGMKVVNGNYVGLETMREFIKNNQDLYAGNGKTVKNLIGSNGKLTSMERQYKFLTQTDEKGKNIFNLSDKDINDLGRGEAALSFLAGTTLKGKVDSAKTDLDVAIAGAKLSDVDKMTVEKLIAAESDIHNSVGFAVGKADDEIVTKDDKGNYVSGYISGITGVTDEELNDSYTTNNHTELTGNTQTDVEPTVYTIVDANGNPIVREPSSPQSDGDNGNDGEPDTPPTETTTGPTDEPQPQPDAPQGTGDQDNAISEIERLNSEREILLSQREEVTRHYPVDENALEEIDAEIAEIDRKIQEFNE